MALSGTVTIPSGGALLKAITFTPDQESSVSEALYSQKAKVATPTFTPSLPDIDASAFPIGVTLACATAGATMMWTLDGTTPTPSHGTAYIGAVAVPAGVPLKAMAFKVDMLDSDVASQTYGALPTCELPTITPNGGAFPTSPQDVTLACPTPGAQISYTLDGSPPTETNGIIVAVGTVISLEFTYQGVTLRAMAFAAGYSDSLDTSAFFELNLP